MTRFSPPRTTTTITAAVVLAALATTIVHASTPANATLPPTTTPADATATTAAATPSAKATVATSTTPADHALRAWLGRDVRAPLADVAECLRGGDTETHPDSTPLLAPNEEATRVCRAQFESSNPPGTLLFASTNVLVGFDQVRERLGWLSRFVAGRGALEQRTRESAQAAAEREALDLCRDYAKKHDLSADACRVAGDFKPERAQDPRAFNGGYWARALALLDRDGQP